MNLLNLVTDPYDRQARLYPAILLLAPLVFSAVVILSARLSGLQSFGAMIVGLGGTFLISQLVRDAGKNCEKKLFEQWGGIPSATIFRHRDPTLDAVTKARYHKKLSTLVKEAKAPSIEEEQGDPVAADLVYTAWSHFLRVNTRDTKKYALLFQENVSYGYRRNVWGMRSWGITAALLSMLVCGIRLYSCYVGNGRIDGALLGAAAFAAILLLLWIFRFTGDWVRVPADAYAERLAECIEALGTKVSSPKATDNKTSSRKPPTKPPP